MPRADRTLARMRANPRDWRIASLEAVAAAHGVNIRKPGGSHVVFEHPAVAEAVSVPARRPIKPVYVRRFVALIEAAVRANEASEEE
jgi:predicted RNA binding protein YcfA (HicA-like mRNA interferase family)